VNRRTASNPAFRAFIVAAFAWTCAGLTACASTNSDADAGMPAANGGTGAPAADSGSGGARAGELAPAPAGAAAPPEPDPACAEPPPDALPDDVFCTGLYNGRDATKYAAEPMQYTPGVTFWSDAAEKRRYLMLPPGSKIDTTNFDGWKFPVGTKAWKEFRFDGKLVETRLFWKRNDTTWNSGTYIWDAEGKAAPLNTSRKPVLLANGYEIPTAKDCGKCHHGASDYLLGLEAVELALPSAVGVTLTKLAAAGSLSAAPAATTIQLPEDDTGKAAAALGYLHANCGMPCHSSRGLGHETELVMRLRAEEFWAPDGTARTTAVNATETYLATVKKDPTTASVAQKYPGDFRITPGSHDKSIVWQLAHTRGQYQMPPLVSHAVDEVGTKALADWIDSLTP
jgi:hypothetical protein